jgi:uncharacterized membrane protein YfcA
MIMLQRNGEDPAYRQAHNNMKYAAGFVSGFLGGLVSMSGPPLVIYMKLHYKKVFFRTQLIGIFFLGTAWRSILYFYHQIPVNISYVSLGLFFIIMLLGLWVGGKVHLKVTEKIFNKIVALILLIPAISLMVS